MWKNHLVFWIPLIIFKEEEIEKNFEKWKIVKDRSYIKFKKNLFLNE